MCVGRIGVTHNSSLPAELPYSPPWCSCSLCICSRTCLPKSSSMTSAKAPHPHLLGADHTGWYVHALPFHLITQLLNGAHCLAQGSQLLCRDACHAGPLHPRPQNPARHLSRLDDLLVLAIRALECTGGTSAYTEGDIKQSVHSLPCFDVCQDRTSPGWAPLAGLYSCYACWP